MQIRIRSSASARRVVIGLSILALCAWIGSARSVGDREHDAHVERATSWLEARLIRELANDVDAKLDVAAIALGVRAFDAEHQQHGELVAFVANARERLRSLQNSDGSIGRGEHVRETTWLAISAWLASSNDDDRKALERARAFVAAQSASSKAPVALDRSSPESVRRAMAFLGTAGANAVHSPNDDRGLEELRALAGGPFDAAATFRALIAGDAKVESGAPAQRVVAADDYDLAIEASVLDHYLASQGAVGIGLGLGTIERLHAALERTWDEGAGAWSRHEHGAAEASATASALIVANIAERWSALDAELKSSATSTALHAKSIGGACEECHAQLTPALSADWLASKHAKAKVGCAACHGDNHSTIFREQGRVSPTVCARCHATEVEEFARSKHARAEATLLASALFVSTKPAEREACLGCHRIGMKQSDGATGSCNNCHVGHAMSSAQARTPEACTICHTGADYPQDLAYRLSKHGALWEKTHDEATTPTCATCHQPRGRHDDGFGITVGGSGVGSTLAGAKQPFAMPSISSEDFAARRTAMTDVCTRCHSNRFAEESLRKADALKADGESMLAEASEVLRDLHTRGKLGLSPNEKLALGPEQIRPDAALAGAELLNRYYEMWRFHYARTWKGAYHGSFSIANLASDSGLADDLNWIRAHARKLDEPRGDR